MSDKIQVVVSIQAKITTGTTVEMTQAQYDEWCDKVDNAQGWDTERVAQELFEEAQLDWYFGDLDEWEVETIDKASE